MHKIEPVKRVLEKATGIGIPDQFRALTALRNVRPHRFRFRADGYIPNNPKLPLLHYRRVVSLRALAIPQP